VYPEQIKEIGQKVANRTDGNNLEFQFMECVPDGMELLKPISAIVICGGSPHGGTGKCFLFMTEQGSVKIYEHNGAYSVSETYMLNEEKQGSLDAVIEGICTFLQRRNIC